MNSILLFITPPFIQFCGWPIPALLSPTDSIHIIGKLLHTPTLNLLLQADPVRRAQSSNRSALVSTAVDPFRKSPFVRTIQINVWCALC
jgi:hypothetical protein